MVSTNDEPQQTASADVLIQPECEIKTIRLVIIKIQTLLSAIFWVDFFLI